MLSFSFHDPDDGWHEAMWVKPDAACDASERVAKLERTPAEAQRNLATGA